MLAAYLADEGFLAAGGRKKERQKDREKDRKGHREKEGDGMREMNVMTQLAAERNITCEIEREE